MKPLSTNGFTLAEVLVVIAIMGIAGLAFQSAIVSFYRQNAYIFESASALDNARRGVETSMTHLRESSYGDDGAFPLLSGATSTVMFHSDIDNDSSVERVQLYILNSVLYRVVTNSGGNPPSYTGQTLATTTLATFIRNGTSTPLFRYYDSTGAELALPIDVSQVSSIGVELVIDLNPNRAPELFTLQGSATLRNLRD